MLNVCAEESWGGAFVQWWLKTFLFVGCEMWVQGTRTRKVLFSLNCLTPFPLFRPLSVFSLLTLPLNQRAPVHEQEYVLVFSSGQRHTIAGHAL